MPPSKPDSDESISPQQLPQWLQVIPLGLIAWSADLALSRGGNPGFGPFFLGFLALATSLTNKYLTAASLITACGIAEWLVWNSFPGLWPLPPALTSFLLPAFLMTSYNITRPHTLPAPGSFQEGVLGNDHLPAWRLILFAIPLMLVSFFAVFHYT